MVAFKMKMSEFYSAVYGKFETTVYPPYRTRLLTDMINITTLSAVYFLFAPHKSWKHVLSKRMLPQTHIQTIAVFSNKLPEI
jgi:hypothetical protein